MNGSVCPSSNPASRSRYPGFVRFDDGRSEVAFIVTSWVVYFADGEPWNDVRVQLYWVSRSDLLGSPSLPEGAACRNVRIVAPGSRAPKSPTATLTRAVVAPRVSDFVAAALSDTTSWKLRKRSGVSCWPSWLRA